MSEANENSIVQRFPARVQTDLRQLPPMSVQGATTTIDLSQRDAILDVIKSHATDPSIFDERDPFVWVALVSNNRVDYYHTIMDPLTTLRNYAEDAINGVAFLNSHRSNQQPAGRSFASALVEREGGVVDLYAAFYTIPDLKNQDVNTTDIIDSIRSGLTKDVSVGFKRGENFRMVCSICGGDMQNWNDCSHFEGNKYEIISENGDRREVIAIAIIVDARLGEVSGVYDGATPTAMIEKAINLAQRGMLKPNVRRALETQFRMALPEANTTFLSPLNTEHSALDDTQSTPNNKGERSSKDTTGVSQTTEGENEMTPEDYQRALNAERDTAVTKLRTVGIIGADEKFETMAEVVTRTVAEVSRLKEFETQVVDLRKAEIEEAVAQGVRAQGDKFEKDRYSTMFERMTLTEIRSFGSEWRDKADEELGGGRRSTETADDKAAEGDKPADKTDDDKRSAVSENFLPDNVFSA